MNLRKSAKSRERVSEQFSLCLGCVYVGGELKPFSLNWHKESQQKSSKKLKSRERFFLAKVSSFGLRLCGWRAKTILIKLAKRVPTEIPKKTKVKRKYLLIKSLFVWGGSVWQAESGGADMVALMFQPKTRISRKFQKNIQTNKSVMVHIPQTSSLYSSATFFRWFDF